ncbi:MAG: hypothetical protein ACOY3X_01795 [Pseudomonadota bacterium]
MKNGFRALVGLWLGVCPFAAQADEEGGFRLLIDGEASVGYDSNVTRAAYTRDIVEDSMVSGSLAAVWNHEFGLMSAATVRGFVDGEAFTDIDTINRASAGIQGMYRWQNALGFTRPFYQVSVTAQRDDSATDLRDANRYTAQAFVTRRMTDALRASVGIEGSMQESEGVVFDTQQARLFVNGDLQVTDNWAVYGTYSFISGDTVSSAQQVFCNGALAGDTYGLITAADEIETDVALNDALCGSWLAYRLEAQTHAAVLGANRGFGHHLSFDVSAQHVMVFAEGDNEYQRTIVRAGILARF